MQNPIEPPRRPWREIAAELAIESDQAKINALVLELERALEARDQHDTHGG
jgi:hypothetical protein